MKEIGHIEVQHTPTSPRELIITDFFVNENLRNTRVGTALFQYLLSIVSSSTKYISVNPVPLDNTITAEELCTIYRHLGFDYEMPGDTIMRYLVI